MKYFEIGKIAWKRMSVYKFDVICELIFSFGRILLAYIMWKAIYKYSNNVGGYTFGMTLTYFIFVSIMKNLEQSEGVSKDIAEEIRSGAFTKYLICPMDFLGYFYSYSTFRSIFTGGISVIALIIGYVLLHSFFVLPVSAGNCVLAIIVFVLAMNCMLLINYCITVLSFYFLQISSFYLVKYNIMEFLTGTLVPLVMFPDAIQKIFGLFPFYYLYQYPLSLYFGDNDISISKAFIVLGIWNVGLFVLSRFSYQSALKRYEGVAI